MTSPERILVPLDGSELAERALTVAARIARASGGTLVLVRVVVPPVPYQGYQPLDEGVSSSVQLSLQMTQVALAGAQSYLTDTAQSTVLEGIRTTTLALEGEAASGLLEAIAAQKASIVVICSHGRTGYKRWLLGSVALKIARHSTVPVLVVRASGPLPGDDEPKRNARILVTLDGSSLAEAALAPAARVALDLASPMPAELELLTVVSPRQAAANADPDTPTGIADEDALERARAYLRDATDRLEQVLPSKAAVTVTTTAVLDSDIAQAIVNVAQGDVGTEPLGTEPDGVPAFDLVAMATHGRTGLQRWALGSTTERMLQSTTLPMLIVRAAAPEQAEQPIAAPSLTSEIEHWPGY